jgi:hypothetical protein
VDFKDPDQAKTWLAWVNTYTFRFNIEEMGLVRGMLRAVLDWDCTLPPPPVVAPTVTASWNAWADGPRQEGVPEPPDVTEARRAWDAVLATPSPVPNRVPAYKFQSNEGWIVTPAECLLLARWLRNLLRAGHVPAPLAYDVDLLVAFYNFNVRAAEHGGYTVD